MPKISVIIPVYNVEKYLPKCLESIIYQTIKDIEIICINDCSTDKSLMILEQYALNDTRIKIINLKKNCGVSIARNTGLQLVTGEYISFIDPDDYIDLNYYEELYKKAIDTGADIVKCNFIEIEPGGKHITSDLNTKIKKYSKFYFKYEFTSAIYRASLISNNKISFSTDLIIGEDIVFINKAVIKSNKIELADKVKYYYIRRDNSLNEKIYDKKKMDSVIKSIEYIAENYNQALDLGEISGNAYVNLYFENIFVLITFIINRTSQKEIKIQCIEKFHKLFYECKMLPELECIFSQKYNKVLDYIRNYDIPQLLEIFMKYKNIQNYCMLSNLRKKVKMVSNYDKNINNNSCI